MAIWEAFCGGTYQALSPVIAADQAVNVYLETRDVGGSAKQSTLYGTPGLKPFLTVAGAGCRGWWSQDDLTVVVVGSLLYRIAGGAASAIGTIPDDGNPVSFASNGRGGDQLGIVGGGLLHVLDLVTLALTAVTLPFAGPVMIVFQDGYGLINQVDTPTVWFSALEDLTTWDALDFFARSGTSDNLVGLAATHDRIWAFGSKTTTPFYDSGDADTPFLPYQGAVIQAGLVSPWLLGVYSDQLFWVTETTHGQRRVVTSTDGTPQQISTPPIDRFLASCSTLDDAELLLYAQEGHPFVAVTAPSSSEEIQTYAYDAREQLWHARAGWDDTLGVYTRWRARGSASVGPEVYVGDYDTGDLYTLDLDTYTDNGTMIRRERTAPYLDAENQWLFLDQFELGMQPGVGLSTGQGSAPVVELQISRDGARTWVSAGLAGLGAIGAYTARAIWRRLGRTRGDRLVVRVIQTDPVKCVFGPGAWVSVTPGTSQL